MRKLMALSLVLVAAVIFTAIGCDKESTEKPADQMKKAPVEVQEVAYICPMKCEGSKTTDPNAKCPVCGMAVKPMSEVMKEGGDAHEGHMHGEMTSPPTDSGEPSTTTPPADDATGGTTEESTGDTADPATDDTAE